MPLFPIVVAGNRITTPGIELAEGHTRLRRAILDGEIPITLPIGFSLNSPRNLTLLSAIDRNRCCQESVLTIATNVSGLFFTGKVGDIVDIEEQSGVLTTHNVTWRSLGVHECAVLGSDRYMFTATAPMSIRFYMHKATGFCSMARNAAVLQDSNCFPLNSVHSLVDYVRVLPLTGDCIEVRYLNGMTAELFQRIWNEE